MMNETLQQLSLGMEVCPFAKDRAISAMVMRSANAEHACEENWEGGEYEPLDDEAYIPYEDPEPDGSAIKPSNGPGALLWRFEAYWASLCPRMELDELTGQIVPL